MNSSRSAVSARRRTGLEHLRRVGLGRVEAAGDAHARSSDRSSRSDAPAEHAREQGPAFASLRLAL
jgi:hypothetical protein